MVDEQFLVVGTREPVTEEVIRRTTFVLGSSRIFETRSVVELANGTIGVEDMNRQEIRGHRYWFLVVRGTYEEAVDNLRKWESDLITEVKPEWIRG